METSQATATKVAPKTPTVVEQKYKLIVNKREEGYNPLPKLLRTHKGRIGSQFKVINGNATTAIIRGLDTNQERFYASQLINKNPKDQGYDTEMTTFWAEFKIDVPPSGLELDASYIEETVLMDGEQVLIKKPVFLDQYIKAEFAKQSSFVAFTAEDRENNELKNFIMQDLSIMKNEQLARFRAENSADSRYVELTKDISEDKPNEKVDYLLDLLKEPHEHFYTASLVDKLMKLKTIAKENPVRFVQIYDDPKLATKSLLFRLTQTRILTLEGSLYFNDTEQLGTEKEAIAFLEDQTKTQEVLKLKARLKDTLLKK